MFNFREQGYIPSNYVRRQGLESERFVLFFYFYFLFVQLMIKGVIFNCDHPIIIDKNC